ncbi:MAG: histidine phosphatase family protein [Sphingobacteriaceae bacterium]|nr:MAG: histidine phosphatase family protein [Sphingobacteriaceae bacterium]
MNSLKNILLAVLLFISTTTFAQTTTVWIVRHAEKATTPANDPDLTPEGRARAAALSKQFKRQKVAAVFATSYKRTMQTGELTLKQAGLAEIKTYNPSDLPAFTKQVLQEYAGKNVLIVGHSNTIIPTLQAFGAAKPFDTLDDEDYDQLFKVTVGPNKKVRLQVQRYGAPHHSNKAAPKNTMTMQAN